MCDEKWAFCIRCTAPISLPALREQTYEETATRSIFITGRRYASGVVQLGGREVYYCERCGPTLKMCRYCGCTDEVACIGGCYWVDNTDVCSRCVPDPIDPVEERWL